MWSTILLKPHHTSEIIEGKVFPDEDEPAHNPLFHLGEQHHQPWFKSQRKREICVTWRVQPRLFWASKPIRNVPTCMNLKAQILLLSFTRSIHRDIAESTPSSFILLSAQAPRSPKYPSGSSPRHSRNANENTAKLLVVNQKNCGLGPTGRKGRYASSPHAL